MSRHGAIDLVWAGGEHTFRLGLGEIEELEREAEMSVFLLYAAVSAKMPLARLRHYSDTIRLGLIGGGMTPIEARLLVRRWVDERPLTESVALAEAILLAALNRVYAGDIADADDEGKAVAPKSPDSTSGLSEQTQP